ncbi:BQ2448_1174 [Microbotryum intermedium]|uniref:BQ2448_1174 protein n=1 Tax=Microbotryum intermedium TaxID=269621 RepID=A0A238F7F3_9BASI|nr:BQ2448_1174 [Microbotryum intermedium]
MSQTVSTEKEPEMIEIGSGTSRCPRPNSRRRVGCAAGANGTPQPVHRIAPTATTWATLYKQPWLAAAIPPHLSPAIDELERLADSTSTSSNHWSDVANQAKSIADALKTPELRTTLGPTSLVKSAASLLKTSVDISNGEDVLAARTELLRLMGNMCFENDPNRAQTHSGAGPDSILKLLANLLEITPPTSSASSPEAVRGSSGKARVLSTPELKFVRAAIGALLNASLKYDPIRKELSSPAAVSVLLAILDARNTPDRKIAPIYVVGSWMSSPGQVDEDEWTERVELGSTIAGWVMSILEDALADDKNSFPPESTAALFSIVNSLPPIDSKVPPYYIWEAEESSDFVDSDIELLTLAAALLEATSIDLVSVKKQLAFSDYLPEQRLLPLTFNFIESARLPDAWLTIAGAERPNAEKAFAMIKAAVVRAVVEAPNDDEVMLEFMRQEWLVKRLIGWLEMGQTVERDDLLVCASHMLAAIGRKGAYVPQIIRGRCHADEGIALSSQSSDEHCVALVQTYGVAAPLAQIARRKAVQQFQKESTRPGGEVTQVLFGVISLLRHLSIPSSNKSILGETGIITIVSMLLVPTLDFVAPLQNAVVGLLKHLTASNVYNSLRLLGAPASPSSSSNVPVPSGGANAGEVVPHSGSPTPPSALDLLIASIKRTDNVRLRSEATRVLANVVRSLFSTRVSSDPSNLAAASPITPSMNQSNHNGLPSSGGNTGGVDTEESLKRRGRSKVVRNDVVEALTEMVRLSEKYPMLINEAIVALTLVAGSGGIGAKLVLESLTTVHAPPAQTSADPSTVVSPTSPISPSRTQSLALTEAGDPFSAALMAAGWLSLYSNPANYDELSAPLKPASSTDVLASTVRPEMIGNLCALLITTLRGSEVARIDSTEIDKLRLVVIGPLKGVQEALTSSTVKDSLKGGVWDALRRTVARANEVVEG